MNVINRLDRKRLKILEIIETGSLNTLKNYLREENLTINIFNYENFDLLIYAIEQFASVEIIEYIIQSGQYKTLNYSYYDYNTRGEFHNNSLDHEMYYGVFKVPLFSAIATMNFKVANLLIKYKADINYIINNFYIIKNNFKKEFYFGDIISYLNTVNSLNKENLKFILNQGFDVNIINTYLLNELVNNSINPTPLLDTIFKHYIYCKDFILILLNIYKNRESLSRIQLLKMLSLENNKITVNNIPIRNYTSII